MALPSVHRQFCASPATQPQCWRVMLALGSRAATQVGLARNPTHTHSLQLACTTSLLLALNICQLERLKQAGCALGSSFLFLFPPLWSTQHPPHFFKHICPVPVILSPKTCSGFLQELMFLGWGFKEKDKLTMISRGPLRKFKFSLFQGAFTFHGSMIDMPLLKQAQNIVTLATAIKKKWAGKWSSRHGAPVAVLKDDYNTWGGEVKDIKLKQKFISILQICHSLLARIANYWNYSWLKPLLAPARPMYYSQPTMKLRHRLCDITNEGLWLHEGKRQNVSCELCYKSRWKTSQQLLFVSVLLPTLAQNSYRKGQSLK